MSVALSFRKFSEFSLMSQRGGGFKRGGRGGGSRWAGGGGRGHGRGGGGGSQSRSDEAHGRGQRHPSHLKGRDIGLWYAKQGGTGKSKLENLPRVELDPARRMKIQELIRELEAKEPTVKSEESAFMRRYRQNLFDNALAADGSVIMLESNEELSRIASLDLSLKEDLVIKQQSQKYQKMMSFREKLPAFQHKEELLNLIAKNQVIVISGETGCGKTTQCCQIMLDEIIRQGNGSQCRIVCTQPRRISAISVAERVAEERDERIGKSVGYCIRLESRLPTADRGTILFCTTGVVFQYLKDDPRLSKYSHVVVDEIHERDVLSDFLLAILKDLMKIRPDLKVILMSATINADKFSRYFGNVPCFNIPGFTFPVQEYYLEDALYHTRFVYDNENDRSNPNPAAAHSSSFQNFRGNRGRGGRGGRGGRTAKFGYNPDEETEFQNILASHIRQLERERTYPSQVINELRKPESEDFNLDLIEALLSYICQTDKNNGAVLIFVPGWDQISKLHNQLKDSGKFNPSNYSIIPLHSLMPTVNQREVFSRPTSGRRKIIISTNIAETSITIDDIIYVIDTGKIKMTNFNIERNIQSLDTEWVSLANATQRKGRAGRVQDGICYHLFSKARLMTLESFKKPEILRKRLEEVVLQIKVLKLGDAGAFLRRLLDPPLQKSVDLAVKRLIQINALDTDENLTPLGFHLAQLPMDPHTGKMILMAGIFSCVDPITTIAAALSFKDPFYIPLGQEKNVDRVRKQISNETKSDHFVNVYAMEGWERACQEKRERDYCYRNYLSGNSLQLLSNMKDQFAQHLCDMKFLTSRNCKEMDSNVHSANVGLIKAIICAGLYPNVARARVTPKRDGSCYPKVWTEEDGRVELHPKSVNTGSTSFESPYLVYFEKMKSTSVFLYDTTMVSAFPLIFFGGQLTHRREKGGYNILSVDHYLEFLADKQTFDLIQALRKHLDKLLEEKIVNPGPTCWNELSREGALLRAITQLITAEHCEMTGEGHSDSDSDN